MTPPLLPAWLRAELTPAPGRARQAVAIAGAATVALAVAISLQFASFPAPLLGFKGLLPSCVANWRNLVPRLLTFGAAAIFAVMTFGFLVQVPWLLVPVFFLLIAAVTYVIPIRQSPIRGYAIALSIAGVGYTAVLAPRQMEAVALSMAVAFSIGMIVATIAARLGAGVAPRTALAAALAASFTRIRAQVREAGERFRAADWQPVAGDPPMATSLAAHLQLLELVQQDLHDPDVERAFVALITMTERGATFSSFADALSRQPVGRAYRAAVDAELGGLLAAVDQGLARFAEAALHPETVISTGPAAPGQPTDWPDFAALLAALQTHRQALSAAGFVARIDVTESVNLNGFVQALEGLADVLHQPPEQLEHAPAAHEAPPRAWLPAFDPYAAQFAAKIALACVVALLVGVTSHTLDLETCILNPLLLAQGSYGATIRQTGLRFVGVGIGGLLAVFTVIVLMPNTGDLATWLVAFFLVTLPCAYLVLGSPSISYLGMQTSITFMIVMVANQPVVDVHVVLWRFFGTLLGAVILFGVFEIVVPDYAGRQLVSRFCDLLRTLLALLPESGRPLATVERTRRLSDAIVAGVTDVLRLAEEARYEGARSGVNREAALQAAGILRRITHRWALIRRGRRVVDRPPLPAEVQDALSAVEATARAHLERLARLMAARHHRSRVGSSRHYNACAAAARVAAEPMVDLGTPLAALLAGVAAMRERRELAAWPLESANALLAEVGHLERIGELLPKLERELVRMILPDTASALTVSSPVQAGIIAAADR